MTSIFSEIVIRNCKYKSKMTINDYVSPYESISEVQEKWKLVPAFLETRGLVKQHLGLARKPRFLFLL